MSPSLTSIACAMKLCWANASALSSTNGKSDYHCQSRTGIFREGVAYFCMRARLSPIELVRPTAFSLAMRSFQQTVGIYQIAERLLTFLVRILILHKAATSGVSSSGTILTTQEFLVPIRHFAASIMVGASPYVNGFCGVMAAYGCAWHDCTQRGGSIPSSFSACNLQNFFKMNSHHHTFGIPTDRRCLQR